MKRIINICLVFVLLMTVMIINPKVNIKAESNGYYNFSCSVNEFELSYITDDGDFEMVDCYSRFDEAREAMMEEGDEYVVRSFKNPSPTMIVAMVSGKAYTYPARSGSSTMQIYQDVSSREFTYKQTYVANHYELDYDFTERAFANTGFGMIKVTLNGFTGYTDLEYTDLVPDKFIDEGLPIYLGGNDKTSHDEQPYEVIVRRNYYAVSNGELVYVYHRSYSSNGGYDEEHRITLGPAPDSLDDGKRYYSSNGYDFYYDEDETKFCTTYYPYYQFLPLRSESNLSADDIDSVFSKFHARTSVMEDNADLFFDAQDEYGVNALLLYAMAAHESDWGSSNYAIKRNNLFGWNAIDSNPNNASYFDSLADGINEQAGYNLRKYMDIFNPLFFGSHLGNKGSGLNVKYASDPYWGLKIAGIAYKIDKALGLKDFESNTIALIDEFDAPMYSYSGKKLFSAAYGPYYQENFTVVVLDENRDETMIQSTNPLDGNTVYTTYGDNKINKVVPYDFDESVVYIDSSYLSDINEGSNIVVPQSHYITSFSDFSWASDTMEGLSITGYAFIEGKDRSGAKVVLNVEGYENSFSHNLTLAPKASDAKDEIRFDHWINMKNYPEDVYTFEIETIYNDGTKESQMLENPGIPDDNKLNGKDYRFEINDDGYLQMTVGNKTSDNKPTSSKGDVSIVNDISIKNGILHLDGTAFTRGRNYYDDTTHTIIIYDLDNAKEVYRGQAKTYSSPIDLNDGKTYDYINYVCDVDISKLEVSNYTIEVSVDGYDSFTIKDSNLISIANSGSGKRYLIKPNTDYYGRLELEIFNSIPKSIDLSKIDKPSQRQSFSDNDVYFDGNELVVNGYGWIFYSDFDSRANTKYDLYLVGNNGHYFKFDTIKIDGDSSITDFYSNDYSDIFYEGRLNLNEIDMKGDYTLYIEISNDETYDFIPVTDVQMLTDDYNKGNKYQFDLHTNKSNKRVEVTVY